MAVIRVIKDKQNPYMMINKSFIYDPKLSLKAKGLMSYFLSRPDDWEFYQSEIKKHTTDRDRAISSAIQELIECGYIKRSSKRCDNGKFKGGYDYEVYETPVENVPKCQNAEPAKCRTDEMPNRQNATLLINDLELNNDFKLSSSSNSENIEVFKHFEKCNFGLISPMLRQKIEIDIEIYSKEWVMKAAEIGDAAGKHNYNYIKGILENWKSNGGVKNNKVGAKNGNDKNRCTRKDYEQEKDSSYNFNRPYNGPKHEGKIDF